MMPVGAECYCLGEHPCIGAGRAWNDEDLNTAINGQVSALVFDDQGKADIEALLAGIAETDFDQEACPRIG